MHVLIELFQLEGCLMARQYPSPRDIGTSAESQPKAIPAVIENANGMVTMVRNEAKAASVSAKYYVCLDDV